jgi:AcrR family transcriptional regulator
MSRSTRQTTPKARGRPLSPAAGDRILDAAIELLGERGIEGMSIDEITTRAGVGKATVYRRWGSKEDIVIAALERFVRDIRIPDSGSLRTDLLSLLRDASKAYRSPRGRLLSALASAMERHPRLAETVRSDFLGPRRRAVLAVLERARERGELGADVDLDLVHDLMVGPFLYRRLFTGGPIDSELTKNVAKAVVSAFGPLAAGGAAERRTKNE